MIKVAGNWELSWNTPIKEAELWNFPLREFQVADWYMWPISGIKHNEEQWVHLHERQTIEEILEENKHLPHVFLEPYNQSIPDIIPQDLREFQHPKDVMYVFGSAHFNPAVRHRDSDFIVKVPTLKNNGVLWPHQCLVTIFYDRLVKGWQ